MSLEENNKPVLLKDLGTHYATEKSKRKVRFGLYKCGYCGKEFKAHTDAIINGNTKSCGCLKSISSANNLKHIKNHIMHGLYYNKFYRTWTSMKQRCENKSNKGYIHYGGRGISICEEWLDVKNFIDWAEANYVEGASLDRIDVNGNYEPTNCRWADKFVQNANQRKRSTNTSGCIGVSFDKSKNKWIAKINVENKSKNLGAFKTLEEAVQVRDEYIISNNLPHPLNKNSKGVR